MKDHTAMSTETLNKKNIFDDQLRKKFLKIKTRMFSIHYLISKLEKRKTKQLFQKIKLRFLNKI